MRAFSKSPSRGSPSRQVHRLLIAGCLIAGASLWAQAQSAWSFCGCSVWAQSLLVCGLSGMQASESWNLLSPALAGGFPSTVPPQKSPSSVVSLALIRTHFLSSVCFSLPVLNSASAVVSSHCRALS